MRAYWWTRGHISLLPSHVQSGYDVSASQGRVRRTLGNLARLSRNVIEDPVHDRKKSQPWRGRIPVHRDKSVRLRALGRARPLNMGGDSRPSAGEIDGHFLLVLKTVARDLQCF